MVTASIDSLTRETHNRLLQQALRYYVGHGRLEFLSKAVQFTLTDVVGADIDEYVTRKSLERDELLQRVSNDRIWEFDEPESTSLDEPVHLQPLPASFRDRLGSCERGQPFVCELPDIELVGPTANPKIADGRYVRDAQGVGRNQLVRSIVVERAAALGSNPRPTDNLDTAIPLVNIWSDNYFHWILDMLPRLQAVAVYEAATGTRPTLVVCADPPSWMVEYLSLLGYGTGDWYEWQGGRISVDTLVVPYGARYKRSMLEWLQDTVQDAVSIYEGNLPAKVFVSREDALCRRVLNQERVVATLSKRGFTLVQLSDYSVRDQIRLFARAETVVAPHGAGLANMLWVDDATIVELFGPKTKACYYHIAEALDIEYGCLFCDADGEDIRADPDAIVAVLEEMGGSTTSKPA